MKQLYRFSGLLLIILALPAHGFSAATASQMGYSEVAGSDDNRAQTLDYRLEDMTDSQIQNLHLTPEATHDLLLNVVETQNPAQRSNNPQVLPGPVPEPKVL